MKQPTIDLFGQVAITYHDLDAWLIAVPRMSPTSPRAAWYIKAYNVAEKIARAKIAGTFDEITQARELPAYWWHRFNWG